MTDGASAALARRVAPDRVTAGTERPITVDQTNRSVVVDEAVIVKWFVPPVPAPHQGVEVLRHLAAVGFTEAPELLGVEERDGAVLASVSEHVAGAEDGWDWFVGELTVAHAAEIGALAGRLHAALAAPSPLRPQPVVEVDVTAEADRWRQLLAEAREVTDREAAAVLAARAEPIEAVFAAAPAHGATPAIVVHGDLHVGQFLRAGRRIVVTDFDGNPLLDPDRRHAPRPLAVDVASLLQSVDHAGRVAQHRGSRWVTDELIEAAVGAADATHRAVLVDAGLDPLLDRRLLAPMRVAQELHELVYAARHLPRWAYAPTATLRAMFPEAAHGC